MTRVSPHDGNLLKPSARGAVSVIGVMQQCQNGPGYTVHGVWKTGKLNELLLAVTRGPCTLHRPPWLSESGRGHGT